MKSIVMYVVCAFLFVGVADAQTKSVVGTVVDYTVGNKGNWSTIDIKVGNKKYLVYTLSYDKPSPKIVGKVEEVGRTVRVFFTKMSKRESGYDGELHAVKIVEVRNVQSVNSGPQPGASSNGTLPADFPMDIPLYRGATVLSAASGSVGIGASFSTTSDRVTVSDFYRARLLDHGWMDVKSMTAGSTVSITASKGNRMLAVVLTRGADGRTIIAVGQTKSAEGELFNHKEAGVSFIVPKGLKFEPVGTQGHITARDVRFTIYVIVSDQRSHDAAVKGFDAEIRRIVEDVKTTYRGRGEVNGMPGIAIRGTGIVMAEQVLWSGHIVQAKKPVLFLSVASAMGNSRHGTDFVTFMQNLRRL